MVAFNLSIFSGVKLALVLLMVAGVLGSLALLLALVRPFVRSLRHESEMVAELLSQLPHELDVTGLVRSAVMRWVPRTDSGSSLHCVVTGGRGRLCCHYAASLWRDWVMAG
jgi:hypothetical protein